MLLSDYQLGECLYEGDRTQVYRAKGTDPDKSAIVKILRTPHPNFTQLVQFRNQYAIARNLEHPGIVRPIALERYNNGYALIMPDEGAIPLRDYWQQSNRSIEKFLQIALQLADALHYLNQQRVIHKDIKPANIIIHPQTGEVKLIDFSISSLLPKEIQALQNPNLLEGTLAYISPEQTGRMNRGIDYRSDFYSLGVTFYELLAGQLPFKSSDPMELVYCHIAKMPSALGTLAEARGKRGGEIPGVLSDIVLKLMAKNAEERYQSALGLKSDLEKCLIQWKESGEIQPFVLGEIDRCDRFLIPDKLYGRETEVETLLQAFERVSLGATEMMLVAGFSGIGKTAVVNEVHKPIVRQRGYFIKGKYDQFNRNIPFSAFVQAFRDLMGQLLSENSVQFQQWKNQILAAVGDSGQVLIDVIPELENIIGKQPPVIELSGSAAQNRFSLLFQKFVQVFTSIEHPLVMFLDDLQWADSASLNLLKLLLQNTGYLLILGAYRNNEVSPVHPFILTVDEIIKTEAKVNTITLPALRELDINQLVADTLNCELSIAKPLTQLVYQKTQGNPFFATQFLKALHDDRLISFDWDSRHWQCDITQIQTLAITDDIVEFMALQLQKLPTETQEALKLAACIGAGFDLQILAIVSQQSETNTATVLWSALQEGLISPTTNIYKFYQLENKEEQSNRENEKTNQKSAKYRFLHDRVQQAAYSLIPDEKKQAIHLKIGQLLQKNLSKKEQEEKLFDIVGHLNLGIGLITQAAEREALARLNLAAGQKARNSTAYATARSFLQTGLELLAVDCWQKQYELTLNLYVAAAETAYLNADFEGMIEIATEVLQSAQNILDKVKIYEIQISALTAQSQMLKAIAVGRNALEQLGVEFVSEPNEALISKALQTLAAQLQGKQISELIHLPVMSNPRIIAAMQLLAMLFAPIFLANPTLFPSLCSTMVSLSLQFGNATASTLGYIGYGKVLSSFLGEVKTGYDFGRLALSLLNQLNVQEFKSQTLLVFGAFLQHRQEALREIIPTLKAGYLAGMETGDFLTAGYHLSIYFYNRLFTGVALDDWELEIENYCVILASVKQDSPLTYLRVTQQTAQNLKEIVNQPDLLSGTAYDETVMFPKHHQNNEFTILAVAYTYKLMLAYIFGNYTNALDYITQANSYLMAATGMLQIPVFHFYAGLTYLTLYSTHSESEQANTLALAETHQTILAQWAHHAPMNYQHKIDLIKAEKCRVLGQKTEAIELYDKAIFGAKVNEYIQEEALANELFAKFYLDWGKEKYAALHMQEAYYCYARWGAKAKIKDLEKRYPKLLAPILQQTSSSLLTPSTIAPLGTIASTGSQTSSSSASVALDLAAILKANQTLSSEIELNKLLSSLLSIIIENAGADKCVLMLMREDRLLIKGSIALGTAPVVLQSIPVEESQEIPRKLIYKVKHSLQIEVVTDARVEPSLDRDPYIQQAQPQSVLCSPILHQGKLLGILYLENNLTPGAFTRERVELLNLLCAQAAISLENAQLYNRSQEYAHQLEQALLDLQNAQVQLVQSEKMSALGNLVSGIGHEMNNPLGFISASLEQAQPAVTDVIEYLNLYQETFPDKSSKLVEREKEIDLDYTLEDLPKILESMGMACDRLKHISQSLRTFSRADRDEKVPFNIHEGIESTVLILKHRLKANEHRLAIEVVTHYGNLPKIDCFPGQLNQVFMNILANAIDALDESSLSLNSTEVKSRPPRITIQTSLEANHVQIKMADNGMGMTEAVKQKIFDHLFTTKGVGKGTGLGLAIVRQIVEEKHGGEIQVNSILGEGTEFIIALPIQGK